MYSFNEIYGNEQIKKSLIQAAKSQRVANLYIFSGDVGSGKSLIARTFAKLLQCSDERGSSPKPCGDCKSCNAFESGNHPDVIYPVPVKTKALGVDDIRDQVNSPAQVKPYNHRYKIFIIENADKMTLAAQNALLKTIEEPADYSVFLFTAVTLERLLPTILSRGIIYKIKPMPRQNIKDYLLSKGISIGKAQWLSAYSNGSIGTAIKLTEDQEFNAIKTMAEKIALHSNGTYAERSAITKELEGVKERITELLSVLYILYRDAMVYKTCPMETFIIDTGKTPYEIAGKNSMKQLHNKTQAVYEAIVRLNQNGNFIMTMDVLLLNLYK